MSYMEDDFYETVLFSYKENDWKNILHLNEHSNIKEATKILWVWPDIEDLKFIQDVLVKHDMAGISSIGCGCGLLEWILQKSTGLPVEGFEINEEWWKSKYSYPSFIELHFPTFPLDEGVLNPYYALFFCYFNNGEAFAEYIKNYDGNVVIIIGPTYGSGRHTDPQPFDATFPTSGWVMSYFKQIKQTKDFIACYIKYN